ncbi:hypothetical protein [Pararcticibacter amylolyticus]|uniref:Late embryogenesis abundant protein LEA-2 subgroup domain-containing protein n=1 Tax=Pararcticibacter amylolyticus TaxID=2173175 RepID=A0A2U2PD67_9SPHI|nr:hypothetical protein [Pararcticibacter amylolyticus]PWG79337.1 hypothetical protein DDR33_17625 [Pararcticibacter amylolyticus]
MRNIIAGIFLLSALLMSCGIGSQVDRLKALEQCSFGFQSADSVYLAGNDVPKLISRGEAGLLANPSLVLAMLQRKIPFKARILIQVLNPGQEEAGISAFEYKIMIKDVQLAEGYFDKPLVVKPEGGTTLVPVKIDTDLYPVLSNSRNQKAIADFLSQQTEQIAVVTLKIKPAFDLGEKKINYPGYIDISREISNRQLKSFLAAR